MTAFDQLNTALVNTSVGWVPKQTMLSTNADKVMIRRQEIIGPNRFSLLVRHVRVKTQHLCGYVHLDRKLYVAFMRQMSIPLAALEVNYIGAGTRDISWRWFNGQRKLVTAGPVSPTGEDYWIGRDYIGFSDSEAITDLVHLENAINAIRERS